MKTLEATNASLALQKLRPRIIEVLIRGIITIAYFIVSGIFFVTAAPNYAPQVCASKPSPNALALAILFLVFAVAFHFIWDAISWRRDRASFETLQTFIDAEIKRRDFPDHIRRLCQEIRAESETA